MSTVTPNDILSKVESLRNNLSTGFRDEIVKSLYTEAEQIARRAVKTATNKKYDFDQKIDRLVTSPYFGLPIMLILLGIVIWLTVSGANVVSDAIATILFGIGDYGREFLTGSELPGGSQVSFGTVSTLAWPGS